MRDKEKDSKNHKDWYRRNSEKRKQAVRERQKQIFTEVRNIKLRLGCSICGYNKCAKALSFHHINDDKEHNIARMSAQGRALDSILEEIKKCVCVCMNCHMEIHDN